MEIIKNIKKGMLQGVGILLMLGLVGVSYAAFQTITQVNSGETLTAATFNKLITNQEDLNTRLNSLNQNQLATAWVKFDGTNCPSNNCIINDSYNVSSVTKLSTGQYNVNFDTVMNNNDYSAVVSMGLISSSTEHPYVSNYTTSSVRVILAHTSFIDKPDISLQVFGGK